MENEHFRKRTRFGTNRTHFDVTDSTNARARELVLAGAPEGSVVTAAFQTRGRGRLDRSWESQDGSNVLASFIAYPSIPPECWGGLSLLAAVAVHEAIETFGDVHPRLKWPNDVLIRGRKIAGILIETGVQSVPPWAIIGIGLNVNQVSFAPMLLQEATSLAVETGHASEIDAVLHALSASLEYWYDRWNAQGNAVVIDAWKERSDMIGEVVDLLDTGSVSRVTVLDVREDGTLLVDNHGRIETVVAGDMRLRRESGREET